MRRKAQIVADENQCAAVGAGFGEQQVDKSGLARGIEGRGRLVGDEDFRLADQRTGGGDALLLADRECVCRPRMQLRHDIEAIKQGVSMGLPERESWRMSFGLLVTLVWLYLEFLRLFALIAAGRE